MPKYKVEVKTVAIPATETTPAVPQKKVFEATFIAANLEAANNVPFFATYKTKPNLQVSAPQLVAE